MSNDRQETWRVKDMHVDDQPRERALKYGIHTLSTPDLWAVILRTGVPGRPITELCREIMRENGESLYNLERRSPEEIMLTKGIGPTKALQVAAVMEIVRRYNREKIGKKYVITSAESIYELMHSEIGNLPHEEIWMVYMTNANVVIATRRITSGSAVASIFDVKAIMKEALLLNAQALAMCHNHPSGTLRPSVDDDRITKKLKEASQLFDMRLLDHLIITSSGYYSYHDSGRL